MSLSSPNSPCWKRPRSFPTHLRPGQDTGLGDRLTRRLDDTMISVFGSNVGEQELAEVRESIESQWMGIGPKVRAFEEQFAARLNLADFAMLDSGSNSLHLAMRL